VPTGTSRYPRGAADGREARKRSYPSSLAGVEHGRRQGIRGEIQPVRDREALHPANAPSSLDATRERVALVHDYLLVLRGAERTFAEMAEVWPQAPIHTLLYDEGATDSRFARRRVMTSPLQHLGIDQRHFRGLLPLYPTAINHLALEDHSLVVSSSSAFAHGARAAPGARHVCYCHSPFRYAWHERERALRQLPRPLRPAMRAALRRHRAFDRDAVSRLTGVIANSSITRDRIRRFWRRDAPIVHPPVDVDRFPVSEGGDDLLFVGEVTEHKRVELALEAAERAGRRIKVIGAGPDLPRLQRRFARSAEFLGRVDDRELERQYANSAALVVPNVEEFGIAAVEAQAAGRPVIAADAGGARETVRPGETGWLVPPDDVDALAATMRRTPAEFDAGAIRRNAERFSPAVFRRRLLDVVGELSGST
jgi:glycosyltransferase involved in cell wall biosynthesis